MPRPASRGMTTVECLVALLVLALGALGGSGVALLTWRNLRAARADALAALHARDRLDLLIRASRDPRLCFTLGGGTAFHPDGVTERWQLVPTSRGWLVTLELTRGTPPRVDTLRTRIGCGA